MTELELEALLRKEAMEFRSLVNRKAGVAPELSDVVMAAERIDKTKSSPLGETLVHVSSETKALATKIRQFVQDAAGWAQWVDRLLVHDRLVRATQHSGGGDPLDLDAFDFILFTVVASNIDTIYLPQKGALSLLKVHLPESEWAQLSLHGVDELSRRAIATKAVTFDPITLALEIRGRNFTTSGHAGSTGVFVLSMNTQWEPRKISSRRNLLVALQIGGELSTQTSASAMATAGYLAYVRDPAMNQFGNGPMLAQFMNLFVIDEMQEALNRLSVPAGINSSDWLTMTSVRVGLLRDRLRPLL